MTILFDPARRVNPSRPFGAGILPPDPHPSPRRPFEPTAPDRAWWAAESARLEARRDRRPAWVFGRADRLTALLDRARAAESFLLRERCDATPDGRPAIDARLAALARRIRRLCDAARAARRRDRDFDRLAAESAALDALERGLVPPDGPMTDEDVARVGAVG